MTTYATRNDDQQLHTHLLIMNGTVGLEGEWHSLRPESLASAYQQKLAEKVEALGYRIDLSQVSDENSTHAHL